MSDTKVEIVKLTFKDKPDYIVSASEWVANGRRTGFKKKYGINQNTIVGMEHTYMDSDEFNSLEKWAG